MTATSVGRSLALALLAVALTAALAAAQDFDILVEKSGPAEAPANSDVTYTVTVTNLGPDPSGPFTLSDPIPAGMTFVSKADPPGFICTAPTPGLGGIITCSTPTMAALASATFTFVFHIAPATPSGTTFVNVATSTANDTNPENDSGIATTSTPPPPSADMGVLKTGPSTAGPDTDVVYTIMVVNGGLDAAANVTLSDTLPGTMTFVSLGQTGTPLSCNSLTPGSGGTLTCTAASYPAGGSTTLTLTGHIPPGTVSDTTFTNVASVSVTTADPNPENQISQTSLTVSSVDISVAKQGPPTATAGDPVSYALLIANGAGDTALDVQLTDVLPPNTTFVSLVQDTGPLATCSTPAPGGTGTVNCVIAVLPSATSAEFTLVIRAGDTTSITNTATGTTDSFDRDHSNDTASTTTSVAPRANLGVTKTGPATATAGADVTYTITVTNGGPSTAATVSLTDTVPVNTVFVSLTQTTGPTFTCNTPAFGSGGTITCTIASLAPAASATFTLVVHLVSSAAAGGSVTNTANVSTVTIDPDPDNDTATTTATVVTSADVGVVKSGPDSVVAGSTATYTIVATNAGPSTAFTVSLTDTVPAGTTFASLNQTSGPSVICTTPSPGGTGTVTCNFVVLPSGASATFSLVLNVLPGTTGTVSNTANVGAATSDPSTANNTSTKATTVAVNADVGVNKSGPASVPAGSNVTYTITVTNNGPAAATTVSLTDTVPPSTTFVSFNQTAGPSFTCVAPAPGGTGTITCDIATLASGASATFSLVLNVSPAATGTISNTASVGTASPDPVSGNDNSTAATTVTLVPADVEIVKTAALAGATAGTKSVTYTIVVTNHGPGVALNVVVTDVLPADATLTSATTTQGSCAGTSTVTCTLGTLSSGGSATITLAVTFPFTAQTVSNTATAASSSPDSNPGNNSSTADLPGAAAIPALSPLAFSVLGLALLLAGFFVLRARRSPAP
jgi:uncharacterized repeat protein (TIGR01451 family)